MDHTQINSYTQVSDVTWAIKGARRALTPGWVIKGGKEELETLAMCYQCQEDLAKHLVLVKSNNCWEEEKYEPFLFPVTAYPSCCCWSQLLIPVAYPSSLVLSGSRICWLCSSFLTTFFSLVFFLFLFSFFCLYFSFFLFLFRFFLVLRFP